MTIQDIEPHQNQYGINLCLQILLTSAIFSLETCMGFVQIYAVLFLRYMGVPVSLISLEGVVSGGFCIGSVPVIGYLTDKGSNQKFRKQMALLLGMMILLGSVALMFITTCLKLYQTPEQKLQAHADNGTLGIPAKNDLNVSEKYYKTSPMPLLNNDTSPSGSPLQTATEPSGVSITAILAILSVILLNVGYDSTASIVRAFVLVCVPPYQQTGILVTATILQSVSGTIFSILGILDLPSILGPLSGMDGVSTTFLIIACYICVCVLVGFITTLVCSYKIDYRLQLLNEKSGDAKNDYNDNQSAEQRDNAISKDFNTQSVFLTSEKDNADDVDIREQDNIPLLQEQKSSKRNNYSPIANSNVISLMDSNISNESEIKSAYEITNTDIEDTRDNNGNTTKLHWNKQLVIVSISYFFGIGGLLSLVEFMPNVLTVGIYQGDPTALPGTDGHALYQKGLRMAALGNFTLYTTYLIMSIGNKIILKHIDAETYNVILTTCFVIALSIFVITKCEITYFLNVVFFGPYRTCLFTIPFVLANKYSQDNKVNSTNQSKHKGKVMSLIGMMMPLHYFILSTFMGPVMDRTNNVWIPMYYGHGCFLLSLLSFLLLFVWKYE